MRDIKFRGKRADNGEWVYGTVEFHLVDGDLTKTKQDAFITYDYMDKIGKVYRDRFEVIPETVGQYTGLKDRNDKEVYEGDVLVCSKYIGGNFVETCYERGYVEFVHGAFGLHRKQGYYRPFKDWLEDYDLEVVGNIYEDGLLKGGEPNA